MSNELSRSCRYHCKRRVRVFGPPNFPSEEAAEPMFFAMIRLRILKTTSYASPPQPELALTASVPAQIQNFQGEESLQAQAVQDRGRRVEYDHHPGADCSRSRK